MLNFIAWFNGVEDRLPENTQFIEQQNQAKTEEVPPKPKSREDSFSSNPDLYLLTEIDFKDVFVYSKKPN